MFWNENTLRDIFAICRRKSFLSFYLRYTYKSIFVHPIIVETLIIKFNLFMTLVYPRIFIRNVAIHNAVLRYRHVLIVGGIEVYYVSQVAFYAPLPQLLGGGKMHR